jgi:hypothetical protein
VSAATELREAIGASLEPVRQRLAEVEQAIAAAERELAELRKLRTEARTLLRTIDPKSVPNQRRGKKKLSPDGYPISEEMVTRASDWLREHAHELDQPFGVPEIMARDDFAGVMSRQTLSTAMLVLADRGVVRLDSIGGQGGGRRNYVLNRPIGDGS